MSEIVTTYTLDVEDGEGPYIFDSLEQLIDIMKVEVESPTWCIGDEMVIRVRCGEMERSQYERMMENVV